MNKITNNISKTKYEDNFFTIDLIRVVMAFVILNFHCYMCFYSTPTKSVGGGCLVCDAFFMISGFFIACTATKEKSPSWFKYCIGRVLKLLPMIILTFLEGVIFSCLLYFIQGKKDFFLPFDGGVKSLWFIWSLWIAIIIIYPILKYSKRWKYLIINILTFITLGCYVLCKCICVFPTSINKLNFQGLSLIEAYLIRGTLGVSFGTNIYFIYK